LRDLPETVQTSSSIREHGVPGKDRLSMSLSVTRLDKPARPLARRDSVLRHDWTRAEALALYELPFMELLFRAQTTHRTYFDPNKVQKSRLLSIKTGGCPEDCGYCNQSAHHKTGLKASKLMEVERVITEAKKAKAAGATRYCMGAAWRNPKTRDMDAVVAMVSGVKALGMETCMTLGMLSDDDVVRLRDAGLDYYNHNVDTSEAYYSKVITTRTYADRLDTLARVRESGMKVCSGGIVGMGETRQDRADMLVTLSNLDEHPESVPINMLIAIPGTPLENAERLDPIEFVRTIAAARIMMPKSFVRLSAGRTEMSEETQALCFFAGANSIFVGDTLLTADNPGEDKDAKLFTKLGLEALELDTDQSSDHEPARTAGWQDALQP
jgi:biotin synthase